MTEDIPVRRRRLCEQLAKLIDGDIWTWLLARDDPNARDVIGYAFVDGGWAAEETEKREIFRHGTMTEDVRFVNDWVRGKPRHETTTRQDILSDSEWSQSPLLTRHFSRAGVSEFFISLYPMENQIISSIFFLRRTGKPPFSLRDKALAHLVLGQVDWLHRADPKIEISREIPTLTHRQRQILFMLLEGEGRKQIARKLRISPHTAADHIQAVYGHFAVNSQSELVSYFYRGGAART